MITIETKGKGDMDFEGLSWVLKVRNTEKDRVSRGDSLTCVNVEAGWLTCTDGMRLHSYGSDYDIEDGVYEVKVCTRKLGGLEKVDRKYPDIDAVFPHEKGWKLVFHSSNNGKATHYVSELYRKTPSEYKVWPDKEEYRSITYDINFVMDSYIPDTEVEGYIKEGNGPLVITSESHCALIMPTRD